MKMKTAMVLAAVSVLVSGCAETKSQAEIQGQIQGVSAQDPWYMIYGWQ
jgi:outer membrane murein-binding lipoprotein Lpp